MDLLTSPLSPELTDKIVLGWLGHCAARNKWKSKTFESLLKIYEGDLEAIDCDHDYIKKQNSYVAHLLASLSERHKQRIVAVLLQRAIHDDDTPENTLQNYIETYKLQLSKEKAEKKLLLTILLQAKKDYLLGSLFQYIQPTSKFNSLKTSQMTLITSYVNLLQTITQQNNTIQHLLAKRIADIDVSFTVPYKSDLKVQQALDGLYAENMITFCCPDYRYYTNNGGLVCDTSVVGAEIGSFGEIVIRSIKKTVADIYALGKLKTLTIIMPTYQIYLTPGEDYETYCNKLLSTANKVKKELDTFCQAQGVPLDINVQLSKDLYTDETIYTRKLAIQEVVAQDSLVFGDFHKKTLQIETNYGNSKFQDILVSDMAEGDLLTECFDPSNTLYFLPEDESMLRPQLIYMMQNKHSQSGSYRGLPTLILQSSR